MNPSDRKILESTPSSLRWIRTIELSYEITSQPKGWIPCCFSCESTSHDKPLLQCSKCRVATYCSKECQVKDWKMRHKIGCDSLKRVGPHMSFGGDDTSSGVEETERKKSEARCDLFHRIRFYACAYAVHQASTLGRGFLFLQSNHSLARMSLTTPHQDAYGKPIFPNRSVLVHYLTLGEYDSEVCRDDFEMAMVRTELQNEVEKNYDDQTQVVVLMRFRCGHVALGTATLVPDYQACRTLGFTYFGDKETPSLQLNIDDA